MNKPEKPKKKVIIVGSATYDFNWVSKKVSWDGFQEWVRSAVPSGAKDVTLELREDWSYDSCFTYLEISWKKRMLNHHYDKELEKYKRKMKKWQKQQVK